MKIIASVAALALAQDEVERGFDYGAFGDYDISAFSNYAFDDNYASLYSYEADDSAAPVGAGKNTLIIANVTS